jgi:ABC-2 type transport system permease protein
MKLAVRDSNAQTRLRFQLIWQLVRKDLKVKYQGSSLGFVWSLANPIILLAVYSFVFAFVFRNAMPNFGLFLMSGMLIWNFFNMAVSGAAGSILGNAGLVKKVPFSHSALPLASVGFAGVQVALQYVVLIAALFVFKMPPFRPHLLLLIPALVVVMTLTLGLGFYTAASTVQLRDTQHILEVVLFAWFWLTPIIYSARMVNTQLAKASFTFPGHELLSWAYYLNPMAGVVVAFQRALYGVVFYPGCGPSSTSNVVGSVGCQHELLLPSDSVFFYVWTLGIGFVVALIVLAIGVRKFRRQSADFAQDL